MERGERNGCCQESGTELRYEHSDRVFDRVFDRALANISVNIGHNEIKFTYSCSPNIFLSNDTKIIEIG